MTNCISDLSDFYEKSTKAFKVEIKINDNIPDISNDVVIFTLKDKLTDDDTKAKLQESADVTTLGSEGTAIFILTPTKTTIKPAKYYYDIVWIRSSGENFPLCVGKVEILERVSDKVSV